MTNVSNSTWRKICFTVFAIAFLISRISIIEGDLSPHDVSYYQKIDSFYYAGLAFEWRDGAHEPPALQDQPASLPSGLLISAIVYLNLITLGDTYFGFRLNVVLASLITSLIFSYLMTQRFGWPGTILSLPVYLVSFPWFMSGLEVEPTVYRLFHMAVLILTIVQIERRTPDRWSWNAMFGVSVLAYCGVLFVYPTNLFVIPALLAFQLVRSLRVGRWREFGRFVCWHAAALGLTLVVWLLLMQWLFGSAGYVFEQLSSNAGRLVGQSAKPLWRHIWFDFVGMQAFIHFVQFPGLFYVWIASLCAMACVMVMRSFQWISNWGRDRPETINDPVVSVFCWFNLAFFFQTLFAYDTPERKMVFAMPLVVFGILFLLFSIGKLARGPGAAIVTVMALMLAFANLPIVRRELFVNYSEKMKGAMVSLQSLGNAEVIGGMGHAFVLYNDIRPYLNAYVYQNSGNVDRAIAAISGEVDGVVPRYSIQILVSDESVRWMAERGYVLERFLLAGTERGVGNVALFRWVGASAKASQ